MKPTITIAAVAWVFGTAIPASGVEWSIWQADPAASALWMSPQNWTPGLPDIQRAAQVENGGTVVIDADASAAGVLLGSTGGGSVQQRSGSADVAGRVSMVNGRYELLDGRLTAASIALGDPDMTDLQQARDRESRFVQSGGVVDTSGNLEMCVPGWIGNPIEIIFLPFREITYELSSGEVLVGGDLIVGSMGTAPARFTQAGGEVTVAGQLRIEGVASSYQARGGELTVSTLEIGPRSDTVDGRPANVGGTLSIAANTTIRVSERLTFGAGGTLAAEPGSTIRFSGHTIENANRAAFLDNGMSGLKLIVTGENDGPARMEVGGFDRGPSQAGMVANYALDTLQIGDDEPGWLTLVDDQPNQLRFLITIRDDGVAPAEHTPESLYVDHLRVTDGSILDLGGSNLYYQTAEIAAGAIIRGGTITPIAVPEPSSFLIAVAAVITALGGWRRSRLG